MDGFKVRVNASEDDFGSESEGGLSEDESQQEMVQPLPTTPTRQGGGGSNVPIITPDNYSDAEIQFKVRQTTPAIQEQGQ